MIPVVQNVTYHRAHCGDQIVEYYGKDVKDGVFLEQLWDQYGEVVKCCGSLWKANRKHYIDDERLSDKRVDFTKVPYLNVTCSCRQDSPRKQKQVDEIPNPAPLNRSPTKLRRNPSSVHGVIEHSDFVPPMPALKLESELEQGPSTYRQVESDYYNDPNDMYTALPAYDQQPGRSIKQSQHVFYCSYCGTQNGVYCSLSGDHIFSCRNCTAVNSVTCLFYT
ncbi:hypothetical protein ABW19_dt0202441 [Dactylella cylindrospora]|nr:hypothetical protein ABW19_dt0202441 [Dactylella cylindrospora]